MTIRILVAAERTLVREAFVRLLGTSTDMEVVEDASSGREALEKARTLLPNVVLMDLSIPAMDAIATTRLIRSELPDVRVVLIGAASDEETIVEAIRAGACGYVTKASDGAMLIDQIRRAATGGVALSEAMTGKLINALALAQENSTAVVLYGSPSAREREVLALICEGTPNKGIASILSVSENTVRAHVRSLMQKLEAENRTQLAIHALQNGLGLGNGRHVQTDATTGPSRPPSVPTSPDGLGLLSTKRALHGARFASSPV